MCESIYEDLCTHLESDNCIFKLLIPSKAVCDVNNKCQIEIDSEHFELRITPFKDSEDCILEFIGSKNDTLKAIRTTSSIVEHMSQNGISTKKNHIGVIGEDFQYEAIQKH